MQKPRDKTGLANPPGVERGDSFMILSVLILLLMLIRKRPTKLKLEIEL
jgi:hypothetical protein